MHDELAKELAQRPGVIALVGFSMKPDRDSHRVAAYLINAGLSVYLVNPVNAGEDALGKKVLSSLKDIPEHIHIVDIFRRSEEILPIIDDAIAVNADNIWLQLEISNAEAEARALSAGLGVVKDRCLKVEHARYAHGG